MKFCANISLYKNIRILFRILFEHPSYAHDGLRMGKLQDKDRVDSRTIVHNNLFSKDPVHESHADSSCLHMQHGRE